MKEYVKANRAMLGTVFGLFAAAALILVSAVVFNDAGAAASLLM